MPSPASGSGDHRHRDAAENGLAVLAEMKELFADAKVIAMSGHEDTLALALRLGAQQVILKPFVPEELLKAVRRVLVS